MDRDSTINGLKIVLIDFFKDRNLDLVDVIYRYEGRDLFLRVLADRPESGISLGECALLNRELGDILDEKNILEDSYTLEVSSPGLDRPLKQNKDFVRCLGKNIKFFLSENISGKLEWDGIIKKVDEEKVYVDTIKGILGIPLDKINKAKQIINT